MYVLARAHDLERAGRRVVHMEIGEPDFTAPAPVVEAGVRALRDGRTAYTATLGLPALREAIARHYQEKFKTPRLPWTRTVWPSPPGRPEGCSPSPPSTWTPATRSWCPTRGTRAIVTSCAPSKALRAPFP